MAAGSIPIPTDAPTGTDRLGPTLRGRLRRFVRPLVFIGRRRFALSRGGGGGLLNTDVEVVLFRSTGVLRSPVGVL